MYYPTRHCTPSSRISFFMCLYLFYFILHCLLLQYQFHSAINKHIDVSFSFLHAPVHLIALHNTSAKTCTRVSTVSSFKHAALQGVHAEPAEDSTFFAYFVCETACACVRLRILSPLESIEGLRPRLREAESGPIIY